MISEQILDKLSDRLRSPSPLPPTPSQRVTRVIDLDVVLIFQHLSKTAGSTLGAILLRQFPPEHRLWFEPGPTVSALGTWLTSDVERAVGTCKAEDLAKVRLVAGHVGFGVHGALPRAAMYLTLLRDPVERLISGFYYSLPRHHAATGETVTLEEYVFRKRHYDLGLNNLQTRVLSGLSDLDPTDIVTTENCRPITEADFALVCENLERHYGLVGLTEQFDEFLVVLARLMGWCLADVVYRRLNVNPSRPHLTEIPRSVIAEVERHNAYDRRLYRMARDMFASRITAYGPSFAADLRLFRRLNALHEHGVPLEDLRGQEAERREDAERAAHSAG